MKQLCWGCVGDVLVEEKEVFRLQGETDVALSLRHHTRLRFAP